MIASVTQQCFQFSIFCLICCWVEFCCISSSHIYTPSKPGQEINTHHQFVVQTLIVSIFRPMLCSRKITMLQTWKNVFPSYNKITDLTESTIFPCASQFFSRLSQTDKSSKWLSYPTLSQFILILFKLIVCKASPYESLAPMKYISWIKQYFLNYRKF